jgi:hypothetical protein
VASIWFFFSTHVVKNFTVNQQLQFDYSTLWFRFSLFQFPTHLILFTGAACQKFHEVLPYKLEKTPQQKKEIFEVVICHWNVEVSCSV